MLSKIRLSVKHFFASITNTKPISPINPQKNLNNFFLPRLENKSAILFWLNSVIFLACYDVAIQLELVENYATFWKLFVQYLILNLLIIFFNIGFTFILRRQLENKTHAQISNQLIINSFFLTPIAVLLANILLEYYFEKPFIWFQVFIYMIVSTIMVVLALALLLKHFASFQKSIEKHSQSYQQTLLEQNEQIKARLTPHFFFNMLNTIQYLIEENPHEAEKMLRSVSNLYRASFHGSHEIGFLDEIEICKHYLEIESYRFAEKLQVAWHLPDEDTLYDMTIPSLTLQSVIEKMIIFVVENTRHTTYLTIQATWKNNLIKIDVTTKTASNFQPQIQTEVEEKLSFNHQINTLQDIYGKQASITHQLNSDTLLIHIQYPCFDVAI